MLSTVSYVKTVPITSTVFLEASLALVLKLNLIGYNASDT